MEINNYMPRIMDDILQRNLGLYGAVSIEGPKWCGKSTTARRIAASVIEMQNPATAENNKSIAKSDPLILLSGEKPRMIDEWQDTPSIWDAVRYDVDKSGLTNQYILTGSVTPKKHKPRHSGTGRIVRITMRPMTLFESNDSNGSVSLKDLFEKPNSISGSCDLSLENIAFLCIRGGWPINVIRTPDNPGKVSHDYLETILESNSSEDENNDITFMPSKMRAVVRSLARNIPSPVTMQTVIDDVAKAGEIISDKTLSSYIDILERIHLLDNVEPWSTELRSKTTIRSGIKRCFADPSLASAAIMATANDLRLNHNTFGLVFESMAIRDLKVYAESMDGRVYYYRDKAGRECDAIIQLPDGRWGAIEIKLGTNEESILAGVASLKKFVDVVDTDSAKEPAFRMILSAATNYAYRREDGVYVVPIGCLKP